AEELETRPKTDRPRRLRRTMIEEGCLGTRNRLTTRAQPIRSSTAVTHQVCDRAIVAGDELSRQDHVLELRSERITRDVVTRPADRNPFDAAEILDAVVHGGEADPDVPGDALVLEHLRLERELVSPVLGTSQIDELSSGKPEGG